MSIALSLVDIRVIALRRGISFGQIARKGGCTPQMVAYVAANQKRTPWVRRLIARELGMTYAEMWGEPDPGVDRWRAVTPTVDTATQAAAQ